MKNIIKHIPETHRLYVLNQIENTQMRLARATRRREARQAFTLAVRTCAEAMSQEQKNCYYTNNLNVGDPVVLLCSWSRDCDMCESTSSRLVSADLAVIDDIITNDYEWAEGPMNHWIQKPSDFFEPSFRDRAMEAYEDGHQHIIY